MASFRIQQKVIATAEAVAVIERLKNKHGELIFHFSGGCCDGSAPMCFTKEEFYIDQSDVLLGEISGCGFYMSHDQWNYYKNSALTLDVATHGPSSFSLETSLGVRFNIKSRIIT
ncbi:MAG: DUF779 domain-containing protein [Bacteroidota bacterium]